MQTGDYRISEILPAGTLLCNERFEIIECLGSGGFGITYKAYDHKLARYIAIKEFWPRDYVYRDSSAQVCVVPEQRDAFQRMMKRYLNEARVVAQLKHPNIVNIIDHIEENGTAYIIMELVEGHSLKTVLKAQRHCRLPEERILHIVNQVVDALATIHRRGIWHLDIKPENIMLSPDDHVTLIDFGAANATISVSQSVAGRVLDPRYAPIELLTGDELGPGSDIFEVGMLLQELLTGERPTASWDRLFAKVNVWESDQPEPWKQLINTALRLRLQDRPTDIRLWWEQRGIVTKRGENMGVILKGIRVWLEQRGIVRAKYPWAILAIVSVALLCIAVIAYFYGSRAFSGGKGERINATDHAAMVWVPAGKFTMGSAGTDSAAPADGKPPHDVFISGYWIYKCEVTVAQYRMFCRATGRAMPPAPGWGWRDTHPIVNVSWHDAHAYADWAGTQLPTEAQWEKAARGTDERIYPWGNYWKKGVCNQKEMGLEQTVSVGRYPTGMSPYNVYDMAGNVWEWCADWEGPYSSLPESNPTGPQTGDRRILRGGAWESNGISACRSTARFSGKPDMLNTGVGFRCVLPTSTDD
ncbi:MAG: Serine/threonine-protein kinase PknA [bacterium ADurb.Bin429]|nr:MAG: Serine/threonine-protein kinase PknA [bacterium ADurb.Bin429]